MYSLDIDHCQITEGYYKFIIPSVLKQTRPGYHIDPLEFYQYEDPKICVVRHPDQYISRTEHMRTDESKKLLLSHVKQYKQVSKDTVARWCKTVMRSAGTDTKVFGPHSSRTASTSKAQASGLQLNDIMKAAGWTNEKTFARFYNKPIVSDNFSLAVLSC